MRPFFQPLNDAVILLLDQLLPNGFDTTDNARSVDTADKLQRIWDITGRVLVWTGFSNHTVYDSPKINYAARAWHDYCHIIGHYPHNHIGETAALSVQKAMVRQLRLWDEDRICRLLDLEVIGQVEYYYRTGRFPSNQMEFTHWFMRTC